MLERSVNRLEDKVKYLTARLNIQANTINIQANTITKIERQIACKHEDYEVIEYLSKATISFPYKYEQVCDSCGLIMDRFNSYQKAAALRRDQAERDLEKAKQAEKDATTKK
jgi:hypothetical protein